MNEVLKVELGSFCSSLFKEGFKVCIKLEVMIFNHKKVHKHILNHFFKISKVMS